MLRVVILTVGGAGCVSCCWTDEEAGISLFASLDCEGWVCGVCASTGVAAVATVQMVATSGVKIVLNMGG